MRDALHLQVAPRAGEVVEQEHGTFAPPEELLQREELAPIAQRIAGKKAQLGKRIEGDPRGLQPVDVRQDRTGGLGELDLGGMKHRVLLGRLQAFLGGDELANGDAGQVPCVGFGHGAQLLLGLRKRYVEDRLPVPRAFTEELHGQGSLPRAWYAFDEVEAIRGETPAKNVVQALDPGGGDIAVVRDFG